ncbi:MAG: agmatine deiminase family protein [Alphaproteobacteria bacterium]|nr:agmatine deiminase family protein [Alphaproteobacteria bacterium]
MSKVTKKAHIPAEWAEQKALWTCWPSRADLWPGELLHTTREEVAQLVHTAATGQKVRVLAMGEDAMNTARSAIGNVAEILPGQFGDIWLRDTGPIFNADGQALRFKVNGWGERFDFPLDETVGDEVANAAGAPMVYHDFILEGGSLDHNGEGALLTTRQCLLNKNRNGWTEEEAERALKDAFGAHTVFWLDEGLMNDHTDGHVDNLARFVGADTVLTQRAAGPHDPNADLYEKTIADLKVMGLNVVTLPSPGLVTSKKGDVIPASHMNFIITNATVIVPIYGAPSTDEALGIIAGLFPSRAVVGLSAASILTGGGSFHCITQQEPKRK